MSSVCGMTRNGQRGCGGKHWTQPPDLAAVVAVASLGVTTLATVAALAGEVQPGAAVVWRVMTREALTKYHERGTVRDEMAVAFSSAVILRAWGEEWPFGLVTSAVAAWSALRALHLAGVHMLAADPARVVLGVEAIGAGP